MVVNLPNKASRHLDPDAVQRRVHVRRPLRQRGVKRLELLLDATAAVLTRAPDGEISLADIAQESGVPLASVYHFFPNRIAALVALAGRHHGALATSSRQSNFRAGDWQSYVRQWHVAGADYLNARPDALRLFMGAGVSVEVRRLDFGGNERIASAHADRLRQDFHCDDIVDLEYYLKVSAGVLDGIWSISYAETGSITDEYLEEATMAVLAYLRCHLPERLKPRLARQPS